jgi:hypothetical protein
MACFVFGACKPCQARNRPETVLFVFLQAGKFYFTGLFQAGFSTTLHRKPKEKKSRRVLKNWPETGL